MQFWSSVLEKTASITTEKPFRLSVQAMKMASSSRFLNPLGWLPSIWRFHFRRADTIMDRVQKDDRTDALQRPLLPLLDHRKILILDSAYGRA